MGLDMYLKAKRFLSAYNDEDKEALEALDRIPSVDLGDLQITELVYDAMYWRKANHIHAWFVKNVQEGNDDCGSYYVSTEQLQELLTTCKAVLADPSLAPQLLPTQSGFFFGGVEYNDWYFQDVRDTATRLEELLKLNSRSTAAKRWISFEYHSAGKGGS